MISLGRRISRVHWWKGIDATGDSDASEGLLIVVVVGTGCLKGWRISMSQFAC